MADELKIKVGADVSQADASLKKLGKTSDQTGDKLEDFGKDAKLASDGLAKLTSPSNSAAAGLAKTAIAAEKAGGSMDKAAKGANQAGNAVNNFSRIVQDAPFGLVGITNNINPLLESFQRLKVETGSTSAAFKAMVGQLAGGAGLGLAVSVVTSLLTSLAMNGFFASKKEADSAAEAAKKYKDALDGIYSDVGKEATEVASLIAVLKSETETRQRKLQALKDLKEINPEIFNGLTLEKGAVQGLDVAYKNYINSLRTVIAAKLKQAQIEEVMVKLLKLQGAELTNFEKGALAAARKGVQAFGSAAAKGRQALADMMNAKEVDILEKKLADLVSQLSQMSKGIDIDIDKDKKEKAAKKVETINDVIKDLSNEIQFLNAKEIAFGTNEAKAKITAIQSAVEKLLKDFKVSPDDALINKLLYGDQKNFTGGQVINPIKGFNIPSVESLKETVLEPIRANMTKALADKPIQVPIQVQAILDKSQATNTVSTFLADITDQANGIGEAMAESMASGFGENLGKLLAGEGSMKNIFASLFQTLGQSLSQLGDIFIQTAIQVKIFKDLLLKDPTLALIAGIGLKALGALIKTTTLPGFADGVTNFGGGYAMVGERGPELVRLPQGADVVPNHSLKTMEGGGMHLSGNFRVAGTDLVLVLERANKSLGRTT